MQQKRQLKLGAFFSTPGNHLAGWRHPDAATDSDMDFRVQGVASDGWAKLPSP